MFVAIIETAKNSKRKDFKGLPGEYPTACAEFKTLEEAKEMHPDARIFTLEEYKIYHEAMQTIKDHVANQKPWWKLWGKK